MVKLSAVIISHNSALFLHRCIAAARQWADQVIVIDNASEDRSAAAATAFDDVHVITNQENRGFAGAANQGIRLARNPVAILLNPDTELRSGIELLAAAAAPGYGAAAGLLENPDGSLQLGFGIRRFPTPAALSFEVLGLNRLIPFNPINRYWRCAGLDLSQSQDIEQPAGAFLAIRREAFEAIGGFDERYHPVWFEDVDFCKRLTEAGWRIRLVPQARACHAGAHSIRQMPWANREVQWYVSLLKYAAKHFSLFGRAAVAVSVGVASVPRAVVGMLHHRSLEPISVCSRLIGSSVQCMMGRGGPTQMAGSSCT